jgi:hypothetical protein
MSLVAGCASSHRDKNALHFTFLPAASTGVDFENRITENDSVNLILDEYTYMGGGVAVVDINNDGWPDIYVCVSGLGPGSARKNLLFINQHDLTFKEEASKYGLADTGYSTQAVFFDYDRDGRMDMYLVNHNLRGERPNDIGGKVTDGSSLSADRLYHNEGIPKAWIIRCSKTGVRKPVYWKMDMGSG